MHQNIKRQIAALEHDYGNALNDKNTLLVLVSEVVTQWRNSGVVNYAAMRTLSDQINLDPSDESAFANAALSDTPIMHYNSETSLEHDVRTALHSANTANSERVKLAEENELLRAEVQRLQDRLTTRDGVTMLNSSSRAVNL